MPSPKRTLKQMILQSTVFAAGTICVAYAGLALFAALMADRLIFPHPPPGYADGPAIRKLASADGETISSLYLPVAGSRRVILYSHGNGEDLGRIRPLLEHFQSRGMAIFAYDYPGYGTSSGRPSERGVYAAADAAYRQLTEQIGVAPGDIILYGRSLGSGPSFWLAERYPVGGLILDGAFASTFRVMTQARILPWDKFDNLSRLPALHCPLLVIHGTEDRTVPVSHARSLFERATVEKRALWVEGAGHNNLIELAGPDYWSAVESFVK